jgi:hypothetical protein
MIQRGKLQFAVFACTLASMLAGAAAANAGSAKGTAAPANGWQFSFTPYGWMTNLNGDATVRGREVEINEDFFEIVEKSDSLLAWMSYFEARKGRFAFFTDFVWADLGFPGHIDVQRSRPLATLNISGKAQLDYESFIVQSGIAYEVASWQGNAGGHTAFDLLGGARYWNQEVDLSVNVVGTVTVNIEQLGLEFERSRRFARSRSGTLEWIDPVVGARLRHQTAGGQEINLEGDVGGFGAGSEFSWQAVGTYGFDINVCGTPVHSVVGYRALAVDYSESGRRGRNGIDLVQHGPIMGVTLRW